MYVACSPKFGKSSGGVISILGPCLGSHPQFCLSVGRLTGTFYDIRSLVLCSTVYFILMKL